MIRVHEVQLRILRVDRTVEHRPYEDRLMHSIQFMYLNLPRIGHTAPNPG
jgi:hypothetical protein